MPKLIANSDYLFGLYLIQHTSRESLLETGELKNAVLLVLKSYNRNTIQLSESRRCVNQL